MAKNDKKEQGPKTTGYRLKKGAKHTHNGVTYNNREVIQLTEGQFKAFADKFVDPNDQDQLDGPVRFAPPADGSGTGSGAVGASHVPQDIGASTRNPAAPVVNPGNGVAIVGPPSGGTTPGVAPPKAAANTSAATGSPLSPPPTPQTVGSTQVGADKGENK